LSLFFSPLISPSIRHAFFAALSDPIEVREMPLRHFTSFFSGHWVQGSTHAPGAMTPTAKVIKFRALQSSRAKLISHFYAFCDR
jgi:hypothetical protein